MVRSEILAALDTEIARLQQARTLLADSPDVLSEAASVRRGPGRPKGSAGAVAKKTATPAPKRTMSSEGRARIAAAQQARWAKLHKAAGAKASTSSRTAKKQPVKVSRKALKKTAEKKAVAKKVARTIPEAPAS